MIHFPSSSWLVRSRAISSRNCVNVDSICWNKKEKNWFSHWLRLRTWTFAIEIAPSRCCSAKTVLSTRSVLWRDKQRFGLRSNWFRFAFYSFVPSSKSFLLRGNWHEVCIGIWHRAEFLFKMKMIRCELDNVFIQLIMSMGTTSHN